MKTCQTLKHAKVSIILDIRLDELKTLQKETPEVKLSLTDVSKMNWQDVIESYHPDWIMRRTIEFCRKNAAEIGVPGP